MKQVVKHYFRHGNTFADSMSVKLYPTIWYMVWELIKNGWDSSARLMKSLHEKQRSRYKIRVSVEVVMDHPLSPRGPALVITDNGQGLTDEQVEAFELLGRAKQDLLRSTGMTDTFGLGRLSGFGLMENAADPFYCITSTSAKGSCKLYTIPRPQENQPWFFEEEILEEDDSRLLNARPAHSFATIVIPNVCKELQDITGLRRELTKFLPRRVTMNTLSLFVQGDLLTPPELPKLQIQSADKRLVGYFARIEEGSSEDIQPGVLICDALSGSPVDNSLNISGKLPYPFGVSELTGVLFVPDLIKRQNTARAQLSAEYFKSAEWKKFRDVLTEEFSPPLIKHLGGEITDLHSMYGEAIGTLVRSFESAWGRPEDHEPPSGEVRPNGGFGGGGGGGKGGKRGSQDTGSWPRALGKFIRYGEGDKVGDYYISGMRLSPEQSAEYNGATTADGYARVYLNSCDPLIEPLKRMPAAFELHIARIIFDAIETERQEGDPDRTRRAVNKALLTYVTHRNKKTPK